MLVSKLNRFWLIGLKLKFKFNFMNFYCIFYYVDDQIVKFHVLQNKVTSRFSLHPYKC